MTFTIIDSRNANVVKCVVNCVVNGGGKRNLRPFSLAMNKWTWHGPCENGDEGAFSQRVQLSLSP